MATNKKIFASKKSITIFFDVEEGIRDKIINHKHNIQLPSSKTEKNIIQENAKNFARTEFDKKYFFINIFKSKNKLILYFNMLIINRLGLMKIIKKCVSSYFYINININLIIVNITKGDNMNEEKNIYEKKNEDLLKEGVEKIKDILERKKKRISSELKRQHKIKEEKIKNEIKKFKDEIRRKNEELLKLRKEKENENKKLNDEIAQELSNKVLELKEELEIDQVFKNLKKNMK